MLPVLGAAIHSSSELPLGAYTYSRYAHLALHRMLLVLVASEVLWYSVLGYHLHHSTWCTEHPYATHSLPESVHMLVCLGSHYLYISFSQLLIRMHTMYDVYNAAPACIIYSYSCPPQRVYIRPPLSWSVLYSTASPLLLCVCVSTYLYPYIVWAPVYYTVHAPYHTHGILPHLTRHHVRYKYTQYTYQYIHNMPPCMSSYHLLLMIPTQWYIITCGTCYMACAITRSIPYMVFCHVSVYRYHIQTHVQIPPQHGIVCCTHTNTISQMYPQIHRYHGSRDP